MHVAPWSVRTSPTVHEQYGTSLRAAYNPCGSSSLPFFLPSAIHTRQVVQYWNTSRPSAPCRSWCRSMPSPPPVPGPGPGGGGGIPLNFHPYDPALRPLSKAQTWPLSRIRRNRATSHTATSNSAPPVVPDRSRDTTTGGGTGSGIGNDSGTGNGTGNGNGNGNGSGVAADLAEALRTVASVSQPIPLSDAARPPIGPGTIAGNIVDNRTIQAIQPIQAIQTIQADPTVHGGEGQSDPPMPPAGQMPLVPATQEAAVPARVGEASERGREVPLDPPVIEAPPGGPSGGSSGSSDSSGSSGSSSSSTTNRVTNSASTSAEDITPPSDETRGDRPGGGSADGSSGDSSGDSSPSSHSTLSSASRRALIRPIKIGPIKYCQSAPLVVATVFGKAVLEGNFV